MTLLGLKWKTDSEGKGSDSDLESNHKRLSQIYFSCCCLSVAGYMHMTYVYGISLIKGSRWRLNLDRKITTLLTQRVLTTPPSVMYESMNCE